MRPIDVSYKICGPAVTVRYLSFDPMNLSTEGEQLQKDYPEMIIKMNKVLSPGDIIVAATLGRSDAGVFGDGILYGFKAYGASGVIVDGGERDVPIIREEVKIPVFMTGTATPTIAAWHIYEGKPAGVLPKEINVPVICDGVRVRPGDIIIGDECGVIVIPVEYADEVAKFGGAIEDIEKLERELITKGEYVHGQRLSEEQAKQYGLEREWSILDKFRKTV